MFISHLMMCDYNKRVPIKYIKQHFLPRISVCVHRNSDARERNMETPKWMNRDLFDRAFKAYFRNKSVQILGCACKPAVPIGENYTSYVFKANVTYSLANGGSRDTVQMIIKFCAEAGVLKDLAIALALFDKEIEMFSRTLPRIYEITGQPGKFSSLCFYSSKDPVPLLLLQDITTLGFGNFKARQIGFDFDHCAIVLKRMAAFHAASVVMYERDPSMINKNHAAGLFLHTPMVTNWLNIGFEALTQAVGRWPEFEKYHLKMKSICSTAVPRCMESWGKKVGGFNVLNHGDLWVNNMMFSYGANGQLKDCKFIDFQLVVYSSPAVDLHYFLATSPRDDVRAEYIDYFLDFYYANFLATLTNLKYTLERIPTREEFRADYKARAFYGLVAAATVTPLVKSTNRPDATFTDLFSDGSDDSFRYHAYNNDHYKSAITHLLPYYDNLGIFDD